MMSFSTANQFHQNLTKFMEFYRGLGEVDSYNLKQGELKTEVMYKDDKKYHMDLKENARGRFLKVSETNAHSRFHVFIPADGMREFKQNIGELIEGFDTGAGYGNNGVLMIVLILTDQLQRVETRPHRMTARVSTSESRTKASTST